MDSAFGELKFSIGWKTSTTIHLFEKTYTILIKVHAYAAVDGITPQQEQAMSAFRQSEKDQAVQAEKLLSEYDTNAAKRFVPTMLLFSRDGDVALLCDDNLYPDEGVAVVLAPKKKVVSQDEYL